MKAFQAMTSAPIFLQKSKKTVPYPIAIEWMKNYAQKIYEGKMAECLWFLEHPPLYTAGTSAKESDLFNPENFPVFRANRGGQWTYHGPGMRILYVMLDLRKPHPAFPDHDIRAFVHKLEDWIILTLKQFGITAEKREGRVGLWVVNPKTGKEEKIAALGIKLHHWISYHGIALNIHPNLQHYSGIVPCGLRDYGVTSMKELDVPASFDRVDQVLQEQWNLLFQQPLKERPFPEEFITDPLSTANLISSANSISTLTADLDR